MNFKQIALLIAAVAVVSCVAVPKSLEELKRYTHKQYMADFHKKYLLPSQEAVHRAVFERRLEEIVAHNSNPRRSYSKGVNHLTDLLDEELTAMRGARMPPAEHKFRNQKPHAMSSNLATIPSSFDWRDRRPTILTAVKDQGECGSCWAHASTETIESHWALHHSNELFVLSQQQIASCTPMEGSCYSCNGSYPGYAFEYAADNGVTQEWQFGYQAYEGQFVQCPTNVPQSVVLPTGFAKVGINQQSEVIDALVNRGPMTVLVDASSWPPYSGGVFDGCSYANNITLDHAVQLIGYGTDETSGLDYWIIRNSWSASWGEEGFIRIKKTSVPECGWNDGTSDRTGCWPGSANFTWVCGECGVLMDVTYPLVD